VVGSGTGVGGYDKIPQFGPVPLPPSTKIVYKKYPFIADPVPAAARLSLIRPVAFRPIIADGLAFSGLD